MDLTPHVGAVDRSLIFIKVLSLITYLQFFPFVSHFLILSFQKNELDRNRQDNPNIIKNKR